MIFKGFDLWIYQKKLGTIVKEYPTLQKYICDSLVELFVVGV